MYGTYKVGFCLQTIGILPMLTYPKLSPETPPDRLDLLCAIRFQTGGIVLPLAAGRRLSLPREAGITSSYQD